MSRTAGRSLLRGLAIIVISLLVTGFPVMTTPRAYAATNLEVGIFEPGSYANISKIKTVESTVGVTFKAAKWYDDWSGGFDPAISNRFKNGGYIPEFTWQPQENGVGVTYASVLNGSRDAYINQTANAVKSVGYTVRISLAPEMNGSWSPWYVGNMGGAEDFKNFWRYVVNKFNAAGATNVEWIWSPNVRSWGDAYSFASIYPGDAYVTYTGLDGYNWGTTQSWSTWMSFAQVFGPSYNELTAVTGKSILIMETASTEQGGDKAAWITDMFAVAKSSYPKIKGFTWFNENKESDWRIQSSTASAAAFKNAVLGVAPSSTPTPTPTATPKVTPKATTSPKTTTAPKSTSTTAQTTPEATPTPDAVTVEGTIVDDTLVASSAVAVSATVLPNATNTRRFAASRSIGEAIRNGLSGANPNDQLALMLLAQALLVGTFFTVVRNGRRALEESSELKPHTA